MKNNTLQNRLSHLIANKQAGSVTQLPFVTSYSANKAHERSFWDVTPSGDYTADCETGQSYGIDALHYMVSQKFTPLLSMIVEAMPDSSRYSGLEVGFLSVIAQYAVIGVGAASMSGARTESENSIGELA